MTRIVWDAVGERTFETGVDRGVLYPLSGPGVPWNGLVSVEKKIVGGDHQVFYLDGQKYMDWITPEFVDINLEAFSYPKEFGPCLGELQVANGLYVGQQPRVKFGLAWRTLVGDDLVGSDKGYKINVLYNCMASPENYKQNTLTKNVSANTRTFSVSSIPPSSSTYRPTSLITIDSRYADPVKLAMVEDQLYGAASITPIQLSQSDIRELLL